MSNDKNGKWVKEMLALLERTDPDVMVVRDVAKRLAVSENTIYRWRAQGCDARTALALECLVRRAGERRAEIAQREIDRLKAKLDERGA